MKLSSILTATGLALLLTLSAAHADKAQIQKLVPNVERPRLTEKTYIFSRSQLKYGLQRTNYLSRWVDQPLFVDPALDDDSGNTITYPSFVKMAQVSRQYGLDGFAFFPQTAGRYLAYGLAEKANVPGFHLLNEFIASGWRDGEDKTMELAIHSPQSLRFGGKLVFTSYRADSKPLSYWQKMLSGFRQKYGDQFIFIPDVDNWAGQSMNTWRKKYHANKITAQDITKIENYLSQWAEGTDGLYYAGAASFQNLDHTYDADFYRNFVAPLMKNVLAKPQFRQKYFGLSAVVGHENSTRLGITLSSDATKTLRESMDVALDAKPDIIVIPEWDEQNENTSLRPTVYNGLSSMRIMRYYTTKLHNENLAPLPGDNLQIPNLIVSYRKMLITGEPLKVELLNVPDTEKSTFYSVQLSLLDDKENVVHTFAPQQFDGTFQAHDLIIPSEEFSQYDVLRPRLEITENGHKSTFEDGLHYIDLRSTWNWDYKWVKQSLRDQLNATKVLFTVGDKNADGTRTATAQFDTDEPLARVQVLDNDDVIYEYSPQEEWREDKDKAVLSFEWESLQLAADGLKLSGDITLQNADGDWSPIGNSRNNTADTKIKGNTFSFAHLTSSMIAQRVFLAIPKNQLATATLKINLPGIYEGTIPVRDIMDKTIYGIPGTHSFNLVISRYVRQSEMMPLLKTKSAQFTIPVLPDLPSSVLHLQAIGVSGHIYRSAPVVLMNGADKNESITVFSNTKMAPVQESVQMRRVPDIRYQFNPSHGSILMTDAGRPFWGVLGGYSSLATARGGDDGTPFIGFTKGRGSYPPEATQGAPAWTKLDDSNYALQFDGKGTYIALGQGVIPRRAAFTIEMDIKPDSATGKQIIVANNHYYPGSIVIYTENGILKADYGSRFSASVAGLNSGLELPAGKWSHLTIRYDQKNIVIDVDGKASKELAAAGPGMYDTGTSIGGYGESWFAGEIKSLRIKQGMG